MLLNWRDLISMFQNMIGLEDDKKILPVHSFQPVAINEVLERFQIGYFHFGILFLCGTRSFL